MCVVRNNECSTANCTDNRPNRISSVQNRFVNCLILFISPSYLLYHLQQQCTISSYLFKSTIRSSINKLFNNKYLLCGKFQVVVNNGGLLIAVYSGHYIRPRRFSCVSNTQVMNIVSMCPYCVLLLVTMLKQVTYFTFD